MTPPLARLALALAFALPSACASAPPDAAASPPPHGAPATPSALAPIHWIEDDHARAFEVARAARRPIFVDTWATWCHSCLALKADVLTDPRLTRFSDRFVWLSLDVERDSAAPFLERFPQPAYPTLWILRPDGTPLLRWVGTLTAPQLEVLLDDATAALAEAPALATSPAAPTSPPSSPTAALLRADAAAAEGRFDDAVLAYGEALDLAPPDWPRRSRAANALLFILMKANQLEAGLTLALREVPLAPPGATGRADLVIGGLDCAASLGPADPRREPALRALLAHAEAIARDDGRDDGQAGAAQLLADDRSGVWMAIVGAWEALGDTSKKAAASQRWVDFLESAAAASPTPEARAVLDSHRMVALLAIGRGEDALAALARSERDFPDDYNPPARRAYVLSELGRLDEAKAAALRALTLAYGPRRTRIQLTLATIYDKQGAPALARQTLEQALAEHAALPAAQRSERALTDLRKRLAAP